jgi:TonB family protein
MPSPTIHFFIMHCKNKIARSWFVLSVLIVLLLTVDVVTAGANQVKAMTIYGHVTDETGTPISGAILAVKWTERENQSDQNGAFTIENVTDGDTIVIHHKGFQSTEFPVRKSLVNYIIHLKEEVTPAKTKRSTSVNITGVITNSEGFPVSDAVLVVKGTGLGTMTNAQGKFSLNQLPVESTIAVTHVSFQPKEFIVSQSKTHFELALQKNITQLNDIVVVGTGPPSHPIGKKSTPTSENAFVAVEQNPEFPGGMPALYKYLADQIKYPPEASKNNVMGKVFISFSINEEGKVRKPQIVKGLAGGIDEEVLRVILNMPPWTPAMQNGKGVTKDFSLAIVFSLP